MLFFNFVLSCVCIWLSWWVYHRYIRMAHLNKERFQLYDLRDRLAILAMQGTIEADSTQYTTLIKLLNNSISVMAQFDITQFLRLCIRYQTDKKVRQAVETIMSQIEHQDDAYRKIVANYFSVMRHIMHRHTVLLRLCAPVLRVLIRIPIGVLKLVIQFFEQKERALRTADSDFAMAVQQAEVTA